jgi:hypothetical protein
MVMKVAPKTLNKFAWSISGLTEVIGQSFETSSDEGRILSWADKDGYWLTLICDDEGKVHAIFYDSICEKMYVAIGYCRYHNINFELNWEGEKSNGD